MTDAATARGPRPQRGAPNARHHIATVPAAHDRRLERLLCPCFPTHTVTMEWETRQGLRTGRLVAWCHGCRCQVPARPAVLSTHADVRQRRQQARLTQALLKADAQARREYIARAIARGEKQIDIAERLGITKQRVSRIVAIIRGGHVIAKRQEGRA